MRWNCLSTYSPSLSNRVVRLSSRGGCLCMLAAVWLGLLLLSTVFGLYKMLPPSPTATVEHPRAEFKAYTPPGGKASSSSSGGAVDAMVLLSLGEYNSLTLATYGIESIRMRGKWKGPVFLLTDAEECFQHVVHEWGATIVPVSVEEGDTMAIKAMKCRLFDFLPWNIVNILYVDLDVVVTRHLDLFMRDLSVTRKARPVFPLGMFEDAGGHMVGFCAGCDEWHSGVILMHRTHSTQCLKAWQEEILGGEFPSDQAALDHVVATTDACRNPLRLPARHLLFAKDYIALFLTAPRTFTHMTSLGHLSEQGWFYRKFAAPFILNNLKLATKPAAKQPCPAM